MIEAVVGFMLSHDEKHVVLIRKNRPEFLVGLLNGPGGKLEPGEGAQQAMSREFFEETNLNTKPGDWRKVAQIEAGDWLIHFFTARGNVKSATSITDERVHILTVSDVMKMRTVQNVKWLVPLCFDKSTYTDIVKLTDITGNQQ